MRHLHMKMWVITRLTDILVDQIYSFGHFATLATEKC